MKNKRYFKSPVPSCKHLRWNQISCFVYEQKIMFIPILISAKTGFIC